MQVREREEEEDEQEVEEEKGAQLVRLPFGAEVAARIVRLDCSFSPFRHKEEDQITASSDLLRLERERESHKQKREKVKTTTITCHAEKQ